MARCDVCGNDYSTPITVSQNGKTGVFDCFECAVHAMAPRCANCGVRVLGRGVETGSAIFCCPNCAKSPSLSNVSE